MEYGRYYQSLNQQDIEMSVILETQSLCKSFNKIPVVSNLNITINEGEIIGIIGSNGAGKTTFINIVTGYLKPDKGAILFRDRNIAGKHPHQIVKLGIRRSFQIPQLFLKMTVMENILIAYSILSKGHLSIQRPLLTTSTASIALSALAKYQMEEYADATVSTLSQGMRKLLDIAMAMAENPIILFLDEPTSGVSAEEKFKLMDTIMNIIKYSGITTICIEHDMELISKYVPRVIAFHEGHIIADSITANVMINPKVKRYIIGNGTRK